MAWEVAEKAVYEPFMDLMYMVYMLQFQESLAVKEEVVKDLRIVACVEVMLSRRTSRSPRRLLRGAAW